MANDNSGIIDNSKAKNKTKGSIGEEIASQYLLKNKYKIIDRNYKNSIGEIDIIAIDKKENRIVFVEVKSRDTARYGYPREAITKDKQQKLRILAESYLRMHMLIKHQIRFDVVEVLAGEITHIKAAF